MPKRLNTLKRKKRQPTHTPHPHNKIPPKFPRIHPEVSQCAQIQGFGLPKRPSKFPPIQQSTPKFHNTLKSKVSDYLKRPPSFAMSTQAPQTDTLQFLNLQNHLSRSQKVTKRHSEFLYTHEVREFLTIQRPNAPDQTPTPHPRSILGSLIASKIRYLSREFFTPWGSRPTTTRATANGR